MQFILRTFKNNLMPALLRIFALVLLLGIVLGQIPALNALAAGEPKLILTKSIENKSAPYTAQVGETLRYRIRLECSSLVDPCGELSITDVLQAGLTYLPPPNSSVPAGFTIVEGVDVLTGRPKITITKDDEILLDGSQYDAVIAVKVNYDLRNLPATIDNQINGEISPDGGTTWLDALPADAPPITIEGLNPSWGLTKTLFSPSIYPTVDTDVTYQIRLCPTGVLGNVPLQNIVITDTLPVGAVFISASDGGTNSSGVVTWNVAGSVTPPACATRYVTILYPKAAFPIGTVITNTASFTASYLDSLGVNCPNCLGSGPVPINHPIDDIFDVPSYDKSDVGDPVGMSGTARFVLSLNTNGTNYPPNEVTLIDNMPPQLQVTEVTSGQWSAAFDYVRAYVQYSTDNGVNWTQFPDPVGKPQPAEYNENAVYSAPSANITNVRWRFEYDADGDGIYIPGLPYTWSFTSNPEIRVKPRTVTVVGPPLLPAAVNGATYSNCVQVSRVTGDPLAPDPVTDACKYEDMTVRGDFVSLRTSKAETPGVSWDDLYDPLIQTPGFIADYSILPGDMLKYTITVDMTERSSVDLIHPTIQDTIPADLVFVRNGTAKLNGTALATQPTFTQVGQSLKWDFIGLTVLKKALGSNLLTVEFFARIPRGQAPGSRTNNMYVVTDSTDVLCEITGTQSTDTGNIDGDASSAEAACKTIDTYIVERSAALRGEKWIRSVAAQNNLVVRYDTFAPPAGTLADPACPNGGTQGLVNIPTNPFTRYPCISRAFPKEAFINNQFVPPPPAIDTTLDDFEYNLRIFNDGNVGMIKYVLYDILPYYGDKGSGGTLTNSARESQFRPALRGPVQLITPAPGGLTDANFSIEYNLTANPCRPEVFNESAGLLIPSGCDNNWSSTWSAAARSYRIRLIESPTTSIPPSTTSSEVRFGVPMFIPADVDPLGQFNSDDPQSYEIAWNSFSHVGSYTDLTSTIKDLLASEPRKVGITIPEVMSIGNRVWRDSDNSGTINPPDDITPGIASVVVNLYRDANDDGIADGAAIATTTTDAGGYYLFSNIFFDSSVNNPTGLNNNRYIVGIPASNFTAGNPLENLRSSTGTPANTKYTTLPADVANADKEDSGIDPTTPGEEVFSPRIILNPNTESASESDFSNNIRDGILGTSRGVNGEANSDSDLTVDFGFFGGNNIPFSIGNHVWFDDGTGSGGIMNNGIRESNELPVVGAKVYLYRDGNDNQIPEADEQIKINLGVDMLYDITDSNGFYLFDNLDPGRYFVQIAPSNFAADPDGSGPQLAGPLAGWYSSQPTGTETTGVNGGTTTADIDSDDNGVNEDAPESKGVFSGGIVLIRNIPEPLAESHLSGQADPGATSGNLNPTGWDGPYTPEIPGLPPTPADGSRGRFGETDATSNLTVDFGFIPPMSLGNRLWIDDGAGVSTHYNNGIMDSGELGVNGALVELWRDTNGVAGLQTVGATPDRFIRNDTTNADGYYLFNYIQPTDGSIEPYDYFVHIPASNFVTGGALENYVSSTVTDANDNADDIDDNGIDSVTPMSTGITSPLIEVGYGDEPLTSPTAGFTEIDIPADTPANVADYGTDRRGLFGQADNNSNLTVDFGFMAPMSIGNRVWLDSDNSGTINAADNTPPGGSNPGIANVVVNLYVDTLGDGIPDDLDLSGTFDPTLDRLATDTTDVNGYYLFSNLGAGNYIVGIPAINFGIGAPLENLKSSTGTPVDTKYTSAVLDNNPDQADHGGELVSGAVYSPTINLSVGAEPAAATSETDLSGDIADGIASRGTNGELDSNSDLTVDFGFYSATTPYSIGNHLWRDDGTGLGGFINDGIRQAGEPVVAGARVELYRDGNLNHTLDLGEMIRFDVTDSNGFYLFDNLELGEYYVKVASSNFAADPDGSGPLLAGPLAGWYSSLNNGTETIGINGGTTTADIDNDDNGIDTNDPKTYGVISSVIILGGAAEPTNEIFLSGEPMPATGADAFNPTGWDGTYNALPTPDGSRGRFGETDATSNLTIDFGFIPPMSLGNRVWIDSGAGVMANYNNGIMDSGELGVSGARVELYRDNTTSGTVGSYDAGDTFIEYKNTDASGYYLFELLQSGSNYFVHISASNFTGSGALVNYVSSFDTNQTILPRTIPADDKEDIDDNGIDSATPATTGITSSLIAMLYGDEPQTSAPADETDNTANLGTLGQTDLNSNLTVDFGFVSPMSLGNRVWRDSDNSGTLNAADNIAPGIALVTVNLYQDADINGIPDGASIDTDTTDTNGYYLFDNLPAGNYIVGIPASNFATAIDPLYALKSSTGTPAIAKYTTTPVDETNLDKQDHGRDPAAVGGEVFSPTIKLTIGAELTTETDLSNNAADGVNFRGNNGEQNNNSDLTVDFGFYGGATPYSVGNRLWYDNGAGTNLNDGIWQAGELPVVGARVELYRDGNGNLKPDSEEYIRFDVTDAPIAGIGGGYYLFDNLDPGTYFVLVAPGNFTNLFDPDGGGAAYLPATGVLRGWYSSQFPVPPPGGNAEVGTDSDDDGIDTNTPELNGVFSSLIVLGGAAPEPAGETLSGDTITTLGFNPTAGDGAFSIGRFGETDASSNLTVDFGFIPPMSLGNRVWIDDGTGEATFRANFNNGFMDTGEVGMGGVRVELWRDTNLTPGSLEVTGATRDTLVQYTTTDANGYYLFERLQPGSNYYIHIRALNFAAGGPLQNYVSSFDANQTTVPADDEEDKDDNGIDNGNIPATNGVTSPRITMAYGLEPQTSAPVDETDINNSGAYGLNNVGLFTGQTDLNSNLTMDFGFVHPPRSLGNYLWFDTGDGVPANAAYINNGIFDTGELHVPAGVRVSLYRDTDNDGIPDDVNGTPANLTDDWIAFDTTDTNGYYLFDNLPVGHYLVGVDGDNFDTGGLTGLVGYTTSTGSVDNASSNLDSRDNGIDRADPTVTATWTYGIISTSIDLTVFPPLSTLPLGETGSGNTTTALGNNPTVGDGSGSIGRYGETDENSDLSIDFGFVEAYALGNRVWFDTNNNGLFDDDGAGGNPDEVGINGVEVALYKVIDVSGTPTPIAVMADGVARTAVTNASGYYLFDYLAPGEYVVVITADNFDAAGTYNELVGYWSSLTERNGPTGAIVETPAPDPDANGADTLPNTGDDDVDLDDNGTRQTSGTFNNAVISNAVTIGFTGTTEPTGETDLNGGSQGNQSDGRANMKVDFGFYMTEIGNLVYEDLNLNGTYDDGAPALINDAIVRLYRLDGTEVNVGPDGILGTTDDNANGVLTGANSWSAGEYRFSGLPEGEYIVKVTTPSGMLSTIDDGSAAMQDDNNNPDWNVDNNDNGDGIGAGTGGITTSDTTNLLTMTPGGGTTPAAGNPAKTNVTVDQLSGTTTDNTVDFGFVKAYSLGNRVWFDTNNDGVLNGAERGINGVRVELYQDDGDGIYDGGDVKVNVGPDGIQGNADDLTGDVVTAANSGANGYYRFDNLIPGEYIVVLPADNFTVGGTTNALVGYWSTGTAFNGSGVPADSTNSDLDNDPDNDQDAFNGTPATSDDNGLTTFNSNKIDYVASKAITLGGATLEPTNDDNPVATSQTNEAQDDRSNRTVDFGFYRVEIGNLVFMDVNQNGTYAVADGDTLINGALVHLYAANNTTEIITGADGILGTADDTWGPDGVNNSGLGDDNTGGRRTSATGVYLFSGLPAGDYIIKVDPPIGTVSTIDTFNAADSADPDTKFDNNDNGIGVNTGSVSANPLTMTPGEATANNNNGTTTDLTVDFGFTELVAIGNRIWFDTGAAAGHTNNHIFDVADEVGVPDGVIVELYTSADVKVNVGPDGIRGTADDLTGDVTTKTIGVDKGFYKFDNLLPGTYYVKIPASMFNAADPDGAGPLTTGPLLGYVSTTGAGANETSDQTADENGIDGTPANPLTTAGIKTQNFTLAPNSEQTVENQANYLPGVLDDNNVNFTADFGFVNAYALGNRVWYDTNNDGDMDASELPIEGVEVKLYRADGSGDPSGTALDTDFTNIDGYYLFDNLAPGNYVVVITADNFIQNGSNDKLVGYWSSLTERNPTTGVIEETPAPDPDADGADATPNTGDDDVDVDDNGTRTALTGFVGAVVSKPVTLGLNGLSEPTDEDDATQKEATVGDGLQPDGRSNLKVDFGFYRTAIGNLVFEDVNLNGKNDSEPVIANVAVTLYNANNTQILIGADGILGTVDDGTTNPVLTDALGKYLFTGLPEGSYIVKIVSPTGGISTVDTSDSIDTTNPNTNNTDDNDNGVGEGTGTITSSTTNPLITNPGYIGAAGKNTVDQLSGTTTDPTVDFGIVPGYGLGNRVWFDTNNNGVMDGAEVGVQNVVVNLYAANVAGNPIGSILATDTTNTSGFYLFDDLFPRDYVVVINKSNFASGGALAGYWSSGTVISGGVPVENLAPAAPAPDPDTDLDIDDNGTRNTTADPVFGGAVISKAVSLGGVTPEPTGELAAQLESGVLGNQGNQPDARANMTVDFGFYQVAIGNLVYEDINVNGTYNSGGATPDTLLNGVTVHLYSQGGIEIPVGPDGILGVGVDNTSGVVTGSVANSWAAGEYHFSGLPAGDYIVRVEPPTGAYSTIDSNPQNDNDDPDIHADNNDNGVGQDSTTVSANVLTMSGGETGMFSDATGITTDNSVDFGFVNHVAIGNRIWFDTGTTAGHANNGILDVDEVGVPDGIIVELYNTTTGLKVAVGPDGILGTGDDAGGDVTTATVGLDKGFYKFDNLLPGTYYVKIPASEFASGKPLDGYVSTIDMVLPKNETSDQTVDENGLDQISVADLAANGIRSNDYTLAPNTMPSGEDQTNYTLPANKLDDDNVNFTADFGFVQLVAIGNRVWYDIGGGLGGVAKDGIQNGNEAGVPGVRVELYFDTNNNTVYNPGVDLHPTTNWFTTTGANGNYAFDNLVPGKYFIHIPASEFTTGGHLVGFASSPDTVQPPKDETSDQSVTVTNPIADENGIDVIDLPLNGITTQVFTLTPNTETVNDDQTSYGGYLDNDNVNFTADFGFVNIVAIGNRIWKDTGAGANSNNGILNADEVGVNGVTVQLWTDPNGDGNKADGVQIGSTITTVDDAAGNPGYYVFDNLLAGKYVVYIPSTNFDQITAPLYGYYSTQGNGANKTTDNLGIGGDENGVDNPTPAAVTGGGITSTMYDLSATSEPITDEHVGIYLGVLNNNDVNFTADFGFVQKYTLGNRVWFDTNDNALMEIDPLFPTDPTKSEIGVNGVTVQLWTDPNNDDNPSDGVKVGSDITTANGGYYLFDNIYPGNYVVVIPPSNFSGAGKLAGYWSSLTSMGAASITAETAADDPDLAQGIPGTSDDDKDLDDNGTRSALANVNFNGAVISKTVTIGPSGNTEPTDETDVNTLEIGADHQGSQPNDRANMKVDFGFYKVSVGDLVFSDGVKDGTYVSTDDAILPGVLVHLFASNGITATTEILTGADGILGTADDAWGPDGVDNSGANDDGDGGMYTDTSGEYLFSGLPRGTYVITVDSPIGTSSTIDNGSAAMQADNDSPNDNLNDNDNGDGSIGGPVSSAPVTLTPGVVAASNTVTNSDGSTHNPTLDFGFIPAFSLGNRVWFDTNNNGTIDLLEVGINGVTVALYHTDASDNPTTPFLVGGVPLTDVTHSNGAGKNGYYLFNDLPADNYVVVIASSNFASGAVLDGYWSSSLKRNDDDTFTEINLYDPDVVLTDSDDNGIYRPSDGDVVSKPVTLGPNPTEPINEADLDVSLPDVDRQGQPDNRGNMTVDFGFYTINLGNLVWEDINNDGTTAGDGVGIDNVDVQLWTVDGLTLLDSTSTSGGGNYIFSGLAEGNYLVRIPSIEFETGNLVDYTSSTGANSVLPPVPMGIYEPAPNPNTNLTNDDDNGTETGGTLGVGGYIQTSVVTLAASLEESYNNADGSTLESRIDFGVFFQNNHDPLIGIAKNLVSSSEISPGTYQVIYDIYVENMGDTPLNNVNVTENLSTTFTAPTTASVVSVSAVGLTVNPTYNGSGDLLTGVDSLAIGVSGTIRLTVNVVPYASGPFQNTATARGTNSFGGATVTDQSQDDDLLNPDPDGDNNPTNNNDPTPVDFGPNLFDPPIGIKVFNDAGLPLLQWTMTWINSTNIAAINARVSDPIPPGTTYEASGASSGKAVPVGAPANSTNIGVTCSSPSAATITTLCYYEGPTAGNLLGRIVWEGTLGPDFGHATAATAVNELNITFNVNVPAGVTTVYNRATIDSDRNGDRLFAAGVAGAPSDLSVADSQSIWIFNEEKEGKDKQNFRPSTLPSTGFAPGVVSIVPEQPANKAYFETGGVWLEVPRLGINTSIAGIPQAEDGTWDVSWLWEQAGWLQGTAYPTLNGNSVITGHVYLPSGAPGPFVDVNKLAYGDKIIIHAYGQKYTYEVRENKQVKPSDTSVLKYEDKAWVTLITCLGYNEASNTYASRVAVKAVLMTVEVEKTSSSDKDR